KGWLYRWQLRHNISFRTTKRGDELTSNTEDNASNGMNELREILANYDSNNVFYCDETCLLYRAVPSRHSTPLGTNPVDKVTLLMCANQDGSMPLPPVLIGRCSEPMSLKGVKKYPVLYTNSNGANMTSSIFHGWLQQVNGFINFFDR